ncbi:MAG: alpha/beta hydrolase [Chloroflexota bacterium]|nr:alpha/beta hydrolase [Chloroflexota bacterium]
MNHFEGTFKGVRDLSIYHQAWIPEHEIKAAILVVHGLGEHSGRYMNVVNHLVPQGYAIYGFDLPGHGKSEGVREFVKEFADYTHTVTAVFNIVKEKQPDKPVFLLGHSMGGLISSYYLLDHSEDFRGAVISAPSVLVPDFVTGFTVFAGKLLSILAPKMGLIELDPNGVSRDPEVVQAYVNDPLVFHGKTTARLSAETLQAMMRVSEEVSRITVPLIILHGLADTLVNPNASQMLYDRASSEDKSIKLYDALYHEVFNEPEHEQVLGEVSAWLEAHL